MVRVERFSLHPPFALRPPFSELFWASCPGASFLSTAVVSNPSSFTSSSGTEKSQSDKKFILIFTNFKSFAAYPNVHVNRREKIRASPSTCFISHNSPPLLRKSCISLIFWPNTLKKFPRYVTMAIPRESYVPSYFDSSDVPFFIVMCNFNKYMYIFPC